MPRRSPPTLCLCLLLACATAPPGRDGPPAASWRHRAPVSSEVDPAIAARAQPAPSPPRPRPLGPLRAFSDEEWRRIRRVQRFVHHAARKRALSPSLINGMIWVESKFERRARGRRGPRGLLQLMPRTARAMARRLRRKYMPYSADFNIAAGTEYLVVMLEQFDRDLHLALAAYNAGPLLVVEWLRAGGAPPKPRLPYVARVERAARAFCERLPTPRYEPAEGPFVCPGPEPEPEPEPGSELEVAWSTRSTRFTTPPTRVSPESRKP